MALKELEVRYAAKRSRDYKLSDGEGLHLLVRPNGSKLWRLKYRFDGREKLLSFGGYPEVSLAQARLRRAEVKVALAEGPEHVMAFATIQSGKEHLCRTSLSFNSYANLSSASFQAFKDVFAIASNVWV